ncbi:MAG: cupin domain-containing protein [Streptosporangiaceae bacterium]|nr:cupin domain-containing protein [Streptosporangiaceae bacterium]
MGSLIRRERQKQELSLRELARRVGVSASMLSQVETDRTRPSVSTIYAIATELGLSIDALLSESDGTVDVSPADHSDADADADRQSATALAVTGLASQLVRPEDRRKLELESGVTWELLSDLLPHLVDFMYVSYEPGGRSSSSGKLMRHSGTEFAYLLRGKLKIQVGFDEYVLQPGDALAFDSTEPHLLVNEGSEPAEGIWFVLGRRLAPESHAVRVPLRGEHAASVLRRSGRHLPGS